MTFVELKILPHGEGLELPGHATPQSAGLDLRAAIPDELEIPCGEHRLIPTGIAIALPEGLEAQVRPRSGLALKYGVTVLNSPGTVDADYRGEIGVILINHGKAGFIVKRGDRIAQLVVARYERVQLIPVDALTETSRSSNGFGSSGNG